MKKNLLLSIALITSALFAADAPVAFQATDLEGKWIADSGNGAPQAFVFEIRGNKITGVTCGPCDAAHVYLIEDGSVTGDRLSFYIRHDDRGESLAKNGPYRDAFTGMLSGNQIHLQWHREGASGGEAPPSESVLHGELTLIGPLRLQALPARPAPAPQPPAK
jgi:hypothetical protein